MSELMSKLSASDTSKLLTPVAETNKENADFIGHAIKAHFVKIPNIEIVVVNPDYCYTSESESSDNESDIEPPVDALSHPLISQKESLVKSYKPVELIDGLFDFVAINNDDEEEDLLLKEFNMIESNQKFDLTAYIHGVHQPVHEKNLPPNLHAHCKAHPMAHQPHKVSSSKIITYSNRRKNLKREFLGDSTDSEDECKKRIKVKVDDDPLWKPSEKSETTASNKLEAKSATYNKKVKADKKDVNLDVPKCPASKLNGNRHGRGKDIQTLIKYYKCTTSSENKIEKFNGHRHSHGKNVESRNKDYKCTSEKILENHPTEKTQSGQPKNVNKSNLTEFEKFIVTSMATVPKSKTNNSTMKAQRNQVNPVQLNHVKKLPSRLNQLRYRLNHRFRLNQLPIPLNQLPVRLNQLPLKSNKELCDKTTQSSSTLSKIGSTLSEKERNQVKDCETKEQSTEALNIDSKIKRKITIQEYLKRKTTQST